MELGENGLKVFGVLQQAGWRMAPLASRTCTPQIAWFQGNRMHSAAQPFPARVSYG